MKNYWLDKKNEQSKTFKIYNVYTDDSNFDRGVFGWVCPTLQIGTSNILAQRGANPKTFRVYGTYTDSFNTTWNNMFPTEEELSARRGIDDIYLYRDAAGILVQRNGV